MSFSVGFHVHYPHTRLSVTYKAFLVDLVDGSMMRGPSKWMRLGLSGLKEFHAGRTSTPALDFGYAAGNATRDLKVSTLSIIVAGSRNKIS